MHEELWQQLIKLDPTQTAQRANCEYLPDSDSYVITFLNNQYTVDIQNKKISSTNPNGESAAANFTEQLCILAYLINAKDLPLSGKLVKAESLPGGQFFFRGPHELPTKKLTQTFGQNPQLIYEAADSLNPKKCDFGDAAVEITALPRIPLTFVIWAADEEFEARASILFDQTAAHHFLLDALLAAVTSAVNAIIKNPE